MEENKQELITKELTQKKETKNLFFNFWNDSVFSQIIANGILVSIPFITALIVKSIDRKSISDIFHNFLSLEIKLYILLLITIVFLILYYIYLRIIKSKKQLENSILNQTVGYYTFRDLNNILLTTEIELPTDLAFKAGTKNIDLLTAFQIFIPYLNSGIDWDHSTSEGSFIYYNLGPILMSYGLCEKTPSLLNNTDGNINSYDIQTSENGLKFFAFLEIFDRIKNSKVYNEEFEKKIKNSKASH